MEQKNRFNVNPAAETVVNIVILVSVCPIIGAGIAFALIGIFLPAATQEKWGLDFSIPLFLIGLIIIIAGIILWAYSRIIINISRNLYNINDAIRNLHAYLEEQNSSGEETNVEEE